MLHSRWSAACPGLAILLTILAINRMGKVRRDRFDPHTKR